MPIEVVTRIEKAFLPEASLVPDISVKEKEEVNKKLTWP